MSPEPCPREPEVVQALRRGALPEDLRGHAEACPDCREALALTLRLRELAASERPASPPTAGQLWWRAEVIRRLTAEHEAAEKAARPAAWGMVLCLVVAAAGCVLGLAAGLDRIFAALLPAAVTPGNALPVILVLGLVPLVLVLLVGALTRET
jgi:hypothetical protein